MGDEIDQSDGAGGRHLQARLLAEKALAMQAVGEEEQAERLLDEAARIDPEAVSAVLAEHPATPATLRPAPMQTRRTTRRSRQCHAP